MCDSVRDVFYSPLCDTDIDAYRSYLAAAFAHYGYHTVDAVCVDGKGELRENRCRHIDFRVGGADSDVGITVGRSSEFETDGGDTAGVHCGGDDCLGCGFGCAGQCSEARVVGVSCGDVVGSSGGLDVDSDSANGKVPPIDTGKSVSLSDAVPEWRVHATGISGGLGPNTLRNRAFREKKKARKARKKMGSSVVGKSDSVSAGVFESGSAGVDSDELVCSLRDKRIAENRLAEANAKRRLQVLESIDVEADVRRQRSRISAMTERNMVSIEKTHATLVATGNVPGQTGFAETVLDPVPGLVSGSISPNSSASMAEFRALQKQLLDSEAKIVKMAAFLEKLGFAAEHLDSYEKSQWTDTPENVNKVLDMYPEVSLEYDTAADGKFRAVRGYY